MFVQVFRGVQSLRRHHVLATHDVVSRRYLSLLDTAAAAFFTAALFAAALFSASLFSAALLAAVLFAALLAAVVL